jgi:hypothetical protein
LKRVRELREAAIFCYGMSCIEDQTIFLADHESDDHDFVARWAKNDICCFAPVQMKSLVSHDLNPVANLQGVIDSLSKYTSSTELTVALHLNRCGYFDPKSVRVPSVKIAGLWIFGAVLRDQREWAIWGDFIKNPRGVIFDYPA